MDKIRKDKTLEITKPNEAGALSVLSFEEAPLLGFLTRPNFPSST